MIEPLTVDEVLTHLNNELREALPFTNFVFTPRDSKVVGEVFQRVIKETLDVLNRWVEEGDEELSPVPR